MEVVVDIGNTDMEFAFFKKDVIVGQFRLRVQNISSDELVATYVDLMDYHQLDVKDFSSVLISSVVPSMNRILEKMYTRIFNYKIYFFDYSMITDIDLGINKNRLGNDRIIDIKAARDKYPQPSIVIDLGTATTIDILNEDAYLGGFILPGVVITLNSLIDSAEQLSAIHFEKPDSFLGYDTEDQINNGVYYLHQLGIASILSKIHCEFFQEKTVQLIFTGGISNFMNFNESLFASDNVNIHVNPKLAMEGLHKVLLSL